METHHCGDHMGRGSLVALKAQLYDEFVPRKKQKQKQKKLAEDKVPFLYALFLSARLCYIKNKTNQWAESQ